MNKIVGRQEEKRVLERLYQSKKAEFLAIYGRRRVGKTFLISQFFKDAGGVYFEITGSKQSNAEQLINFHREFVALFKSEAQYKIPENWSEAFHFLNEAISLIKPSQKVILFFDELPWLASSKSGFLQALDYFWNRHASRKPNVILIICGSAASWMIKNVIFDRGGLHGRLSAEIRLKPFLLGEVEEFFKTHQINLSRKQIAEIYMATGGIPKYLSYIERGKSSSQIINSLCFSPQAPLLKEFHKLFDSLFDEAYKHVKVVHLLANSRKGRTKKEIFTDLDIPVGGNSGAVIDELEECGFIFGMQTFGKKLRERRFRLVDEYSLFYLKWIDAEKQSILQGTDKDYWGKVQFAQSWKTWAGYAFENICITHVSKIKEALKIAGVSTKEWYWQSVPLKKSKEIGVEIDLVIERADQCINLCEIKFYNDMYSMSRNDAENIERKKTIFREKTKTKKSIFMTLITPFGAIENDNYLNCIDNQLTIDSLFKIDV